MSKKQFQGFTLIEILIVILVISIATVAATLTIGNASGRDMRRQAEQLQRVLQLAAQTAMVEQVDLSIGLWRKGYAVWRFNPVDRTWNLIQNERGFKEYDMPGVIQLSLRINNKQVLLPTSLNTLKVPQIWFSATGEATAAEITVSGGGDLENILVIKNNGEVTILE